MKLVNFRIWNEIYFNRKIKSNEFVFLSSISFLVSLIILNRWIFVPLGLNSIGRTWQHYIGYQDIGFARRSLWGTILNLTKLNQIFSNDYVNAIFLHFLVLTLLYLVLNRYILTRIEKFNIGQIIMIYFSPAFFFHLSYATGANDIVCVSIVLISVLLVNNIYLLSFLSASGVLIHDLYIFFLPYIVIGYLSSKGKFITNNNLLNSYIPLRVFLFLFVLPCLVYFSTHIFGVDNIGQLSYEEIAKAKMPFAYEFNHPYWSGFYEIFPNKSKYLTDHIGSLKVSLLPRLHLLSIPFLYLVTLISYIYGQLTKIDFSNKVIICGSTLLPLLAFPLITEYVRFTCLCSILCLIYVIHMIGIQDNFTNKVNFTPIILYSFLSPFGIIIERSLPLHQFLLN